LDRETQEDTPDYVMPDEEGMNKFNDIVEDFKDTIYGPNYDPNAKLKKKRIKPDGEGNEESNAKKRKLADRGEPIEEIAARGALGTLTIPELKEFLKSKGIKGLSKLTKQALIEKTTAVLSGKIDEE